MSRAKRNVNLSVLETEADSFKKYVTDKDNDLSLDESDSQLSAISLSGRSVTTVVIDVTYDTAVPQVKTDTRLNLDKVYDLRGYETQKKGHGLYIYKGKVYTGGN